MKTVLLKYPLVRKGILPSTTLPKPGRVRSRTACVCR